MEELLLSLQEVMYDDVVVRSVELIQYFGCRSVYAKISADLYKAIL